jgi:hypothetical protein
MYRICSLEVRKNWLVTSKSRPLRAKLVKRNVYHAELISCLPRENAAGRIAEKPNLKKKRQIEHLMHTKCEYNNKQRFYVFRYMIMA